MMKEHTSQAGFTLIEVLIAILILSIGILGVAVMQISAIDGNSIAIHLTGAANEGGDTLETLIPRSYADASLSDASNAGANAGVTGLSNTDTAGSLADGGPVVQGDYTIFWNVAENYPVFGTKTIRVLVRRLKDGQLKTVALDFIKMEPI